MKDLQEVYKTIAFEVQQQLAKQYPNKRRIYKRIRINRKTNKKQK